MAIYWGYTLTSEVQGSFFPLQKKRAIDQCASVDQDCFSSNLRDEVVYQARGVHLRV